MEKEIAIEQERTKMARELHDGLGSMLSGIKHSFAAMTKEFELSDNQELLFHANVEKLNEAIKELRNISHNTNTAWDSNCGRQLWGMCSAAVRRRHSTDCWPPEWELLRSKH